MTTAAPTTKRKRILVLTSTFPRWPKDTEPRFVLDLCRELRNHAEILVLAPHAVNAAREEVLEGVLVRRFRYFVPRWQSVAYDGGITARLRANPWRLLQLPFLFAALWLAVRQAARTWSPDLIHAHWIIPQALVAALAANVDPAIVCTSHGGDLHGLRGRFFGRLKSWALRRCAVITVVSDSMAPLIRALSPGVRVEVLPMGTDLRTLFVPPTRHERDQDHVLFVGRLVAKKGVTYLLRAIEILKTTHPKLRLTIAGDGPLKKQLVGEAAALGVADRVTFVGSVEHRALPALFQCATLAIFPFVVAADGDQEGFGLVVVEAMGCECPVIASDLPAVRHTVEHDVTGTLTPPGNAVALADAIAKALRNPEHQTRLASVARARACALFDWGSIGARYLRLIEELLSR
jgi:glycosyltransferase involved in cell wall biosynthesis